MLDGSAAVFVNVVTEAAAPYPEARGRAVEIEVRGHTTPRAGPRAPEDP